MYSVTFCHWGISRSEEEDERPVTVETVSASKQQLAVMRPFKF